MRIRSELLRQLRLAGGWTQKEVADEVEIDVKTYRNYESGRVNSGGPSPVRASQYETLRGLAALFGLSCPEDLIDTDGVSARRAPAPPPRSGPRPGVLGGTTPFQPLLYVHREREERKALNRLRHPGAPVVIHGPEHFGASTFLGFLLHRTTELYTAEGPPYLLRLSVPGLLRRDPRCLGSLDALLSTIARRLLDLLGMDGPDGADVGGIDSLLAEAFSGPGSAKAKLSQLLERQVLTGAPGPVLLAIEKADRLLGTPFQDDFFGMLRGWAEAGGAGGDEPWARLRLLCTVSTEPILLESLDHSSFFALAAPIRLDEFDAEQLQHMARLSGQALGAELLAQVMGLIGGHPYLMHLLLQEVKEQEVPLAQVLAQEEAAFTSHLQHLRAFLEQQPQLGEALAGVLRGTRPRFEDYCRLYSKGLVVESAPGQCRLRCRLYERYFRSLWRGGAGSGA